MVYITAPTTSTSKINYKHSKHTCKCVALLSNNTGYVNKQLFIRYTQMQLIGKIQISTKLIMAYTKIKKQVIILYNTKCGSGVTPFSIKTNIGHNNNTIKCQSTPS